MAKGLHEIDEKKSIWLAKATLLFSLCNGYLVSEKSNYIEIKLTVFNAKILNFYIKGFPYEDLIDLYDIYVGDKFQSIEVKFNILFKSRDKEHILIALGDNLEHECLYLSSRFSHLKVHYLINNIIKYFFVFNSKSNNFLENLLPINIAYSNFVENKDSDIFINVKRDLRVCLKTPNKLHVNFVINKINNSYLKKCCVFIVNLDNIDLSFFNNIFSSLTVKPSVVIFKYSERCNEILLLFINQYSQFYVFEDTSTHSIGSLKNPQLD